MATLIDGHSVAKKQNGGKRPGAGRPMKGTTSVALAVQQAKQEAIANIIPQFQAELEARLLKNLRNLGQLADGFTKEEAEKFAIIPAQYPNIYLIDRLLGKPKGDDEKPPVTNNTLVFQGYTIEQLRALVIAMKGEK